MFSFCKEVHNLCRQSWPLFLEILGNFFFFFHIKNLCLVLRGDTINNFSLGK